jgi:hypothetical protein
MCVVGMGLVLLTASGTALGQTRVSAKTDIQRGEYLVGIGSCNDCQTPKLTTSNGPPPDSAGKHFRVGRPVPPK